MVRLVNHSAHAVSSMATSATMAVCDLCISEPHLMINAYNR